MTQSEQTLIKELQDQWGLPDRLASRLVLDCPQPALLVLQDLSAAFLEVCRRELEAQSNLDELARSQGRVQGLWDFTVRLGRIIDRLDEERRK